MFAEITAGLGSLKAAMDIAKGLNAANTQALVNEIKISLQEHIFAAQESLATARERHTADAERIRELEQQIVQFKDWEREKDRYVLHDVCRGAFAYVTKPGMENGEPPHWLCTNCFGKRHKSFLQATSVGGMREIPWRCQDCKSLIVVSYQTKPMALVAS